MAAPSPSLLHWHCTVSRSHAPTVCQTVHWGKRDKSSTSPACGLEREMETCCVICVCLGCHTKIPRTGWLKQQKCFFPFHRLIDHDQRVGSAPSETSLLGLRAADYSLCPHVVFPMCLHAPRVSLCIQIPLLIRTQVKLPWGPP